ncbi:protein adenylyltransferase Fic-like [Penaeus chinensis]|uniref:protein adenylyltransferase Fic-like n=1 Tax=Penaeus chinensis TaxID=139456 RepID=UPI001FB704DA|nr:protein adenylyltransferase Fic-like [Penaeus chinensis]
MTDVDRRLCSLRSCKYVFSTNIVRILQSEEMNKFTLFLVFLCGAIFAGLVSLMHSSWRFYASSELAMMSSLGAIPAGSDLELMDDGYVAMALLGAHDEDQAVSKKQTTELEDRHAEIEALNTLKAAQELVHSGKSVRAGRLLEHAFSLAPRHPDVLIHYGEYLEHHRNDIVQADKLYLRALAVSPANSRALRNRRRTRPIVDDMDAGIFSRIDGKRDDLALIPSSSASLRRIKKEAYFQYIYHTAGIEGNTMTLAQTRMILETRLSVGGKSVMEHNEILGLDLALKYINMTLVHRVGRITLHDILEIHRRVLGHVDPIQAGQLRTTQVYVSDHVPPPPTHLQVLMEDFVQWLNSPEAQRLHPIKYSALAHYKLVFIHPFADGNGRTARLLMNFLLMQAGYPPVIIRKQDRLMYYDCLQTANEGDTRPFIRFIAHCTEKTLDVYLWATKEALPKIGQENESKGGVNKLKKDHQEKDYEMADMKPNVDSEEVKKFSFESVDDIPPWQVEEEEYKEKELFSGGQSYIPTNIEDDILKEGSSHRSESSVDHEHGFKLWFASDEDHGTVSGTRRYGRVLNEQYLFEEVTIEDKLKDKRDLEDDENTIARGL